MALASERGFFDDGARQRAELLAALDDQRMLLLELRSDVGAALSRLVPRTPNWQAASARRYGAEREEVCESVRHVLGAVDDAVERVTAARSALAQDG